jgi:hypothetical protein
MEREVSCLYVFIHPASLLHLCLKVSGWGRAVGTITLTVGAFLFLLPASTRAFLRFQLLDFFTGPFVKIVFFDFAVHELLPGGKIFEKARA